MANQETLASTQLSESLYSERWTWGGYIYAGVFVLEGEGLDIERIKGDAKQGFELIKKNRNRRGLRFFSRSAFVPVYCASSFAKEAVEYLSERRSGRASQVIHAVLFDSITKSVFLKEALQNDTLLYYDFLDELFLKGVSMATEAIEARS